MKKTAAHIVIITVCLLLSGPEVSRCLADCETVSCAARQGTAADVLPRSLVDRIAALGIDITNVEAAAFEFTRKRLFCLEHDTREFRLLLLANQAGSAAVIIENKTGAAEIPHGIYTCSAKSAAFRVQQVPPECIEHISGAFSSLISSLYSCARGNPASCVTAVIGLVSDVYLIPDQCFPEYSISTLAIHGAIEKTPDKSTYYYGEEVTLTAIPDTGYSFVSWSGDVFGSENPVGISMDSDKNITATFSLKGYALTTSAQNGVITKNPNRVTYQYGQQVIVTAQPNDGYLFQSWGGDLSGSKNPTTITIDSDKSVTAFFIPEESAE